MFFNDPENSLCGPGFKNGLIGLLGPVHQAGNVAFERDHRRNICGSGKAVRRGSIPFSVFTLRFAARGANYYTREHADLDFFGGQSLAFFVHDFIHLSILSFKDFVMLA
jgi:hypothetical protein